jgi:hypothetical protein
LCREQTKLRFADIPSISVLGLKTTSTARINYIIEHRDAILPFQKIEKLIPKETQFFRLVKQFGL